MANVLTRILAGSGNRRAAQVERSARALAAKAADGDENEDENAEDDEEENAEGDEEENAEGDEDDDENAEGGDDDENAEGEDDDETAEGDEDEGKSKSKSKSATGRERARVAAILNAPEAKGRDALAKHLALETGMAPKAAIAALKASPAGAKGRLAAAMDSAAHPRLGPGGGGGDDETETGAAKRLAGYVNTPRAI